MRLRRHHWGVLILTLLILGGLLGYSLVQNGLFPIAVVNGKIIALKAVEENAEAAKKLWEQEILEKDNNLSGIFSEGEKLFEETLESVVVNTILRTSAPKEILVAAEERIESSLARADVSSLSDTIEAAYGWDLDRFKERILEPQALEEILREKFGDGYDDWLEEKKRSASVKIWFLPFMWSEGKLCKSESPTC